MAQATRRGKPPPAGNDHHLVDRDLNIRVSVKAGPHMVSAAFPKKSSALMETERQPYEAHFNMDRHPRIQPAVYSISVNGPYDAKGAGDTPSRRRILVCTPARPGGNARPGADAKPGQNLKTRLKVGEVISRVGAS